jgi:phospholipid/cholesterol/gamma-HCH transport system substrate-binding protein
MKRSIFGVYQFDEVVGAVVLACIGVFVAVLINAGLMKDWFQPSFTLRILLPDEGVSGLAPGAEVQVLGTRAGEVRRIVIDPNQRMHAVARVEDQMRPFIRRDSVVSIRRQFGVAGAAFIDIQRGVGPELDWSYAVIAASTERAATDTIGQMVDEVRAKITPLFEDVQKAVQAFTAVAQRATDPAGPLEQTLASAAGIARKVESGQGLAGRLISDDKLPADLEATLVSVRELAAQLERTSKDPRITQILVKTDSILTSLQTTTRNLAATTPQITRSVQDTTDAMPATLLQAQIAARELELLLGQLRHHWLFGGSSAPAQPSRRAPAVEVRPGFAWPCRCCRCWRSPPAVAVGRSTPVRPPTSSSTRPTRPARRPCRWTCRAWRCASTKSRFRVLTNATTRVPSATLPTIWRSRR